MNGPDYYKHMAAQWRGLAEIGDPARRAERERLAAALERMAESQEVNRETVPEEKKP